MQTCKGSDRLKSTTLIFTSQGGPYITVLCSAEIDPEGSDWGGGGAVEGDAHPKPPRLHPFITEQIKPFSIPCLSLVQAPR